MCSPDIVVHFAGIRNDYAIRFIDLVSLCLFAGDAVIDNQSDFFGVGNRVVCVTVDDVEGKFNRSQVVLAGKIDCVICCFSGCHITRKIWVVHDPVDRSFSGLNGNIFVRQILNGNLQPLAHPAFFVSTGVGNSGSAVLKQHF